MNWSKISSDLNGGLYITMFDDKGILTIFVFAKEKIQNNKIFVDVKNNGGLPISRVAPLDQLLPLSLGSSG